MEINSVGFEKQCMEGRRFKLKTPREHHHETPCLFPIGELRNLINSTVNQTRNSRRTGTPPT